MTEEETLNLGDNILLAGFQNVDRDSMVVVKKMVSSYARKFSDRSKNIEQLKVTSKSVHEREKSEIYELRAHLIDNGKTFHAGSTERNLFVALDSLLKSIEEQHSK